MLDYFVTLPQWTLLDTHSDSTTSGATHMYTFDWTIKPYTKCLTTHLLNCTQPSSALPGMLCVTVCRGVELATYYAMCLHINLQTPCLSVQCNFDHGTK